MVRRYQGRVNGVRFLGNIEKMQVHDLDNEKPGCQIDEIIHSGNDAPFYSLEDAYIVGHDNCHLCLGGTNRVFFK